MKISPVMIATVIFLSNVFLKMEASAASYDTIPKNVNTFVFKQVMTSKIESRFDSQKREDSLSLKKEFNARQLENISQIIKSYFEELKAISPEAYSLFSLGEFSANVNADVTAQGFGYGFGITDKLTVYGSIPLYHMKTEINFSKIQADNLTAAKEALKKTSPNTALGKFVKDLTLQLPDTNAELLQSLVVNYYNYKPVGTWERDALGDAELGFIYRLTDFYDSGLAISAGAVLPTGKADDPDSLQDIPTGDGQYDAFTEAMAGISFFDKTLQFDIKARYTHQFAAKKEVRWLKESAIPLSKNKRIVDEKLGNKIDASTTITYNPLSWASIYSSLLYESKEATKYQDIEEPEIRKVMEEDTDSKSYWLKIGLGFSTVEAYKRKQFEIPFETSLSAQRLLSAKNSAKYDRIDLDFRFYF